MKEILCEMWESKRFRWVMFIIASAITLNTIGVIIEGKFIETRILIYFGSLVLFIITVILCLFLSLMGGIFAMVEIFLDTFMRATVEIVLQEKPVGHEEEVEKDVFNIILFIIMMTLGIILNIFTMSAFFK